MTGIFANNQGLPGWHVAGKRLVGNEYELEVTYDKQPDSCQKCGTTGRLYKHGQKPVIYRDSPISGHPVRLMVNVQRFKCRNCGSTFQQALDNMEPGRLMTVRCAEYIAKQCLHDTFTNIATQLGLNETTVRHVAADYIHKLNGQYALPEVEYLGIGELYLGGEICAMIADVASQKPVDIIQGCDKQAIVCWLQNYPFRSSIKAVSTDLCTDYRDAVNEVLGVPVVLDKFHVARMMNTVLENIPRRLRPAQEKKAARRHISPGQHHLIEKPQATRGTRLEHPPEIRKADEFKEALFRIYGLSKAEAIETYDAWLASAQKVGQKDLGDLIQAMKNWRAQILNYFDFPVMSAYTEALNGIAKVTSQMGRGYSFEVLRARILFKGLGFPGKSAAPSATPAQELKMACTVAKARLPHYLIRARTRARLLLEQVSHCFSCRGKFEPTELFLSDTALIVSGEHKAKGVFLCRPCFTQFHTKTGLMHRTDSSS